VSTDFIDRDVFAAAAAEGAGVITYLEVRGGFLTGTRQFGFPKPWPRKTKCWGVSFGSFMRGAPGARRDLRLPPARRSGMDREWLAGQNGRRVRIHRPERGEKARLMEMP